MKRTFWRKAGIVRQAKWSFKIAWFRVFCYVQYFCFFVHFTVGKLFYCASITLCQDICDCWLLYFLSLPVNRSSIIQTKARWVLRVFTGDEVEIFYFETFDGISIFFKLTKKPSLWISNSFPNRSTFKQRYSYLGTQHWLTSVIKNDLWTPDKS